MKLPPLPILNPAGGKASPIRTPGQKHTASLQEIAAFGANPGALRAWSHVPPGLKPGAPLVVVLHGCTQNAAEYDTGAGWSQLADELGFALLYPEQQRANNPNLCFNWFSPIDSRRDSGEAMSVREMIGWMVETHEIDPGRIFVTGLSAGGAMASIMLATYPEVFAGGAIIGGLPFGTAGSVGDAFARMAGQGHPGDADLAALVRHASPHSGPWPRISVWHGTADTTVQPVNADRILAQWRGVHDVAPAWADEDRSGHHIHRIWRNDANEPVIEQHLITGMNHGTPLQTHGAEGIGKPGPFMLEVGISSTRAIARFWGLGGSWLSRIVPLPSMRRAEPAGRAHRGVGGIIEDALRAAGLMK